MSKAKGTNAQSQKKKRKNQICAREREESRGIWILERENLTGGRTAAAEARCRVLKERRRVGDVDADADEEQAKRRQSA